MDRYGIIEKLVAPAALRQAPSPAVPTARPTSIAFKMTWLASPNAKRTLRQRRDAGATSYAPPLYDHSGL